MSPGPINITKSSYDGRIPVYPFTSLTVSPTFIHPVFRLSAGRGLVDKDEELFNVEENLRTHGHMKTNIDQGNLDTSTRFAPATSETNTTRYTFLSHRTVKLADSP